MASKNPVATPEMLNSIRAEASPDYQRAVPEATASNLGDVGNPIIEYQSVANEFLGALMNKIVLQLIERRMWTNPLNILRSGDMPLGTDIEDIHVNPTKGQAYDGTEKGMAELLKMYEPDVASTYFRLNRRDKYPVTINNEQLRGAFTSWGQLENLIGAIVDSIYNGCTIDEFNYTKQLVSTYIAAGNIITIPVPNPVDRASGESFMKTLRGTSTMFTFPSTNYNAYAKVTGKPPRTSFTPVSEQVILIRGDVAASVGVDVLSAAFNLSYTDYVARQVIVDNFGDDRTLAVLADEKAFIIKEQLRQFATFFNASSLGWQYIYHAWDLYAMSLFRNAVALQDEATTSTP